MSLSFFFLSALLLTSRVFAAPGATRTQVVQIREPSSFRTTPITPIPTTPLPVPFGTAAASYTTIDTPAATSIIANSTEVFSACGVVDPQCECDPDGSLYCGYVPYADDATNSTEVDFGKREAKADGESVGASDEDFWVAEREADENGALMEKRDEIVQRTAYPLMAALAYIGVNTVKQYATRVILNRLPAANRAKWVTGIGGTLPAATNILGTKFAKGATWEIRWDFAWYNTQGQLPTSGLLGGHVNMLVQDSVNRQAYAFYFPTNHYSGIFADKGETYFNQVIQTMTNKASYPGKITDAWLTVEPQVAQTIGSFWYNLWNIYQKDGL